MDLNPHNHHFYSSLTSAPPTPSMTEGHTTSDLSTTVSSGMSSLLHQKLQDRRRELQREGRLPADDSPEKSSGDENDGSLHVHKGRKASRNSAKDGSVKIRGRRVVSTAGSNRNVGEMGFKEQEHRVTKLEKQNFDLKLRVYHQGLKIQEMNQELKTKTDDYDELMKIVEDQQRELDKRESSLKEAVDGILLLQDKVRHLEKQARQCSGKGGTPAHMGILDFVDDRSYKTPAIIKDHLASVQPAEPANGMQSDMAAPEKENGSSDGRLEVPLLEKLNEINGDGHSLRMRTRSVISRHSNDSRYQLDRMLQHSPAMSVLSEGDFESVYNWKDQPVVQRRDRRYSADSAQTWSGSQVASRTASRCSDEEVEDAVVPDSTQGLDHHTTHTASKSLGSLAADNMPTVEAPPTTPKTAVPDLAASSTFSRRTRTSSYHTPVKRRSDPELHVAASQAELGATKEVNRTETDQSRAKLPILVPDTPSRQRHRSVVSQLGVAANQSTSQPSTPGAKTQRTRRLGGFDSYGFLDSHPTTPQLLGKISPQTPQSLRRNVANDPLSPLRSSLSTKDQQVLDYIARQRVSDWISPSPMVDGNGHVSSPMKPTKASSPKFRDRYAKGSRAKARPNYQRAGDTYPSHHTPQPYPVVTPSNAKESGLEVEDEMDIMSTVGNAEDDGEATHADTIHVLGRAAGQTRDVLFNWFDADDEEPLSRSAYTDSHYRVADEGWNFSPMKPAKVNFAIPTETINHIPSDENAEDAVMITGADALADPTNVAFLPSSQGTGKATRHPPVSLSFATGRRFAGFMRRRGSNTAGTAAAESAVSGGSVLDSAVSGGAVSEQAGETAEEAVIEQGDEKSMPVGGGARRRASFAGLNERLGRVGRKIF